MTKDTTTQWLSTWDAGLRLGVQLRTLYRSIDTGQITAYKMGRVIRLKPEDVEAYIAAAQIQPGQLGHLCPEPKERFDLCGPVDPNPQTVS